MKVNVYCLYDPTECKIRYIGRTKKPVGVRLIEHICKAKYYETYYPGKKMPHRVTWVRSLLNKGREPRVKYLTSIEGWKESHQFERGLIHKYKDKKELTNWEDRGEGGCNHIVTDQSKINISNSLKEGYKLGKINKQNAKKVYLWDPHGNLIDTVESARQASAQLGIWEKGVSKKVRSGKNINGCYVSYTNPNNWKVPYIYNVMESKKYYYDTVEQIIKILDIGRWLYEKLKNEQCEYKGWLIETTDRKEAAIQLVKDNKVHSFRSYSEAARYIGCAVSGVHSVIKGVNQSIKGYKKYKL